MARKTLVEQLDDMEWSEEGVALANQLARVSASDELGAVVLVAAAILLAKEHPGRRGSLVATLDRVSEEFRDLVFRMHAEIEGKRGAGPGLRIVGGTDTIGGAA